MTDAEKDSGAGSYSSDTEDDSKDLSGSASNVAGADGLGYNKGGLMKKNKKKK